MGVDVDSIRAAPCAGVLVPPANPAIEPELNRLLASSATLYAARFPVMPGTTLEQRNARYLDLYRDAVLSFGTLKLGAMIVGLTGPSYRLLEAGDSALCRELSAHAGGTPVATASRAIAEALASLGARRLCLVSPYAAALTAEAVAYWRDAGYDVVQVVRVSEVFRAYELTDDEIRSALSTVDHAKVDVTVMSGTGMLTLPAIVSARQRIRQPILSSNICSAWWLLKTIGVRSAPTGFADVAPELAAQLSR